MITQDPSYPRREVLGSRIRAALVDALESIGDLHSPAVQRLLIRTFERRAGVRLFVPHLDIARDWCFYFVEGCIELDDGVEILVDVVQDLRPGSVTAVRLLRLRDDWVAAAIAAQADAHVTGVWDLLRTDLSARSARSLARAFHHACHPAPLPRHCDTAWQLFLWVAGRAASAVAVPAYAVFLLQCADDALSPDTIVQVDAWLRAEAYREDLTHALNLARFDAAPLRDRLRRACVVSLQYQPVGPTTDDYRMSWWLSWAGGSVPHRGESRRVRQDGFEQVACDVLAEAEEILGERLPAVGEPTELLIEVALPAECLALPVAAWCRRIDGTARFLIQDYAIVARSFDRLRRRGARLLWRERWAVFAEAGRARVMAVEAGRVGRFGLDMDRQIAAVVLDGPPTPGSPAHQQLADALHAGLPVVAWQYSDAARPPADTPLLTVLAEGSPLDLPQRFRIENLRRLAHLAKSLASDDVAGSAPGRDAATRRLATLLWDDPRRVDEPLGATV